MLEHPDLAQLEGFIATVRANKEFYISSRDFTAAMQQRDIEKDLVAEYRTLSAIVEDVGELMFERFTDRARRIVVLAQEEARMLNHNYIGTEHILLGLIHEGEGVAAQVMIGLGLNLEVMRSDIEVIIGAGLERPSGHIPFTPRGKKVLELSLREALQLGHNYIGTEHILLGLVREGEGVGSQILVKNGVELTRVRQAIIQMLSGYRGASWAQAGSPDAPRPPQKSIDEQFAEKEALRQEQLKAEREQKIPEDVAPLPTTEEVTSAREELRLKFGIVNDFTYDPRADAVQAQLNVELNDRSRDVFEIVNDSWVLVNILADHDIEPNVTLITQLIAWRDGDQ